MTKTLELTDKEQTMFGDFMQWVQNYNEYIINAWSDKASSSVEDEEELDLGNLVDVEEVEVA